MSRKLLPIKHHLASGCCMWSGIEDVYATMTDQTVPEAFLLGLSSFGETAYIKTGDTKKPYMFSIVDGRTKKTFDGIKDVLGLHYQISAGRTLEYALRSIYKEVDQGNPVLLGPLDMYHLPYLKMYHRYHIPMHYVTMVGYDEEKDCLLIYDCDRTDLIELPKKQLIAAWQIDKNVVGNKNGFVRFQLTTPLPDKYTLAKQCLKAKANRQLVGKPDFIGINAFTKLAKEFPSWKSQYSETAYREILASLTESFCMVPKLPNAIMGVKEKDEMPFRANYDRYGKMLMELGEEYHKEDWITAGKRFHQCGQLIEEITDIIIQYYCNHIDQLDRITEILHTMKNYSKEAYETINKEE